MDAFEAIEKRRSVKHFDPNHQMTEAEIEKLLSAAMLSPTSFNIQNWRFVVVRDADLRSQVCEAAWNQAQVKEASLLVLMTADLKAWAKQPERYWKDAPEEVRAMLVPMLGKFYDGNAELERDEAMRSSGIAAQTLMLAAKAMGYDSCPMIGFDAAKVAQLIGLPEDHVIGMMITIGKALKPAWPRPGQLPMKEVVVYDKFS